MAVTDTTSSRSNYGEVFDNGQFRTLFGTAVLAIAADTLRMVALSILVFKLTGSSFLSALTFGILFIPQVVGSTFFGALGDRCSPRRLVVTGFAIETVTGVFIGLTHLPISVMLTLVAVNAAIIAAFAGSRARIMARVLVGDAYVLGRSVLNVGASGAQLVGLASAGAAVAVVGARHALLVSAGAHFLSTVASWLFLERDDDLEPLREQSKSVVRESLSGNRALLGMPRVRRAMLAQWLPPTFVAGAESLVVAFALRNGLGNQAPGLLLAGYPVGMIIGDVVVGRFLTPHRREQLVAPLTVLMGVPLVVFALHPSFVVSLVAILLSGVGCASALGMQRRFIEAVPDSYRGQAFGLLGTGLMTVQGLGALMAGVVSEFFDVGITMAIFGALTGMVVAAWLWASLLRE